MRKGRPWGHFEALSVNKKCTVKIITLVKGGRLSLQRHKKREELWLTLDEGLTIEIEGKKKKAKSGERFLVSKGALHRASAKKKARILEVSFGHFDEDDIERIEDDYGRI